jgi:hypothetical protein
VHLIMPYSPECVEGVFSEDEMRRPTPQVRSSLWVCKGYTGSSCPERRIGPPWMVAKSFGKNAKKRAVVAVARKLCVLLHRLWVAGEAYDPLYNTHRGTQREAA